MTRMNAWLKDPRHLKLISLLSHAHRCAWTPRYARCATARARRITLLDAANILRFFHCLFSRFLNFLRGVDTGSGQPGCAVDRHSQRTAFCPGRLVSALMFLDTQQVLESRQVA